MVTLDEAIQEIDSYIQTIIQDMINFRAKRLDASIKVLNKLKEVMDTVLYTYRIGQLYDKAIKIERPAFKQFDIVKPSLQLKYTGSKTRLYTDGAYIDVPSVPIFLFEPVSSGYALMNASTEQIRRSISFKFPITTNIAEEPDMENAYGKYYFPDFSGWSFQYTESTIYAGKKITLMGMIMSIDKILVYQYYVFQRKLTIDGTEYLFAIDVNFGKVIATTTTVQGQEVENVEYPCTWFEFLTDYPGDVSAILYGNEYTRGPLQGELYVRDVLMVFFDSSAIMYQLN